MQSFEKKNRPKKAFLGTFFENFDESLKEVVESLKKERPQTPPPPPKSATGTRGFGGEVVTSPPLNRKVGCSRPTMIRARCLRVRQHYPAQKNNQQKLHVVLKQGHNSGSP